MIIIYPSKCTRFQYILAAPTSIATKYGDPSLTYINQGQVGEVLYKSFHNFFCFPVVRDKDQEAGRLVVSLPEEVAAIDDKNLLP